MKPKLFIVSFSFLAVDSRVLRQIRSLAPHFDITVAGFGGNPSPQVPGVQFRFVELKRQRGTIGKLLRMASYPFGAIFRGADFWPWSLTSEYRDARLALFSEQYDLVLCNDLNTVFLGVEALQEKGIPFVADYHEYSSREATEKLEFRLLKAPHAHRCLKRLGPLAAGSITVNQPFADAFQNDYGFPAIVVLNAPELRPLPLRANGAAGQIHLIHHGVAGPNRNIEVMIRAMAKVREEFTLHLMLVTTPECLAQLKEEAKLHAPGRVIFEEPVPPAEVAARVSHFDVGLLLLENHSFNNRCALPNKVFEYVHGGLGVCSTRSPAMETFIQSHTNGWLIDEVSTDALADCLNSLTRADIEEKKAASLRARESVHAHGETAKMVKMLTEIAERSAGQS